MANEPTSDDEQLFKKLKKSWKQAGSLSKTKYETLQKNYKQYCDIISEQLFAVSLVKNRDKEYRQKNNIEKLKALQRIVKNLLRRDQDELALFEDNMDKMHINKGSFIDMLQAKLETQKHKVVTKKIILRNYQTGLELKKL